MSASAALGGFGCPAAGVVREPDRKIERPQPTTTESPDATITPPPSPYSPAPDRKPESAKPEALLDLYYAAMSDKTLWGKDLEKRIPKEFKFTEELGRIAKNHYVDEVNGGKVDTDWLWIVFRCGGAGLNSLLLERLTEGIADDKERRAIHTEVDRFLLAPGPAGPLRIGDRKRQQQHQSCSNEGFGEHRICRSKLSQSVRLSKFSVGAAIRVFQRPAAGQTFVWLHDRQNFRVTSV